MYELLNDILERLPISLAVFNRAGAVRLVNGGFAELVGIGRTESVDLCITDFRPLQEVIGSRAGSLAALMTAVSEQVPLRWESVLWPGNKGQRVHVDMVFTSNLRENTTEEGEDLFLLMISDVTDRVRSKVLEKQMCHVDRLIALGEMIAGLAHEINNPLCVISGNAQFLNSTFQDSTLTELKPDDWREIVSSFRSIHQESERCCHLVSGLLQLSHRSPVDDGMIVKIGVNDVISDLLCVYDPLLAKQDIRVNKLFDPHEPQVVADPNQLQQVFVNLLSNARQAMPHGGVIEIATKQDDHRVTVRIKDTGPGVKKELMGQIFDPFYTTKPVGQGTGLGLSIASSIVMRYGGSIEVMSDEGRGATFEIRLPSAMAQDSGSCNQDGASARGDV